jgi:quercetin 2,3-dioxygenase
MQKVLNTQPLGFLWPTLDPFLFCAYHDDAYPKGRADMTPDASLAGRKIGQDFERKDGWSMYHGQTIPGFPSHPHRGFETVTIVRKGLIDHSDSLGATARFGQGDVQWLTAGKGIVHSEMFPLLNQTESNPLELFQIWLNLPAKNKMVAPHFTMFWSGDIPCATHTDAHGLNTEVSCISGKVKTATVELDPLSPPPDSWAAQPDAEVAIWTLKMAPLARWTIPAALLSGIARRLYFFKGKSISIDGDEFAAGLAIQLNADLDIEIVNGSQLSEFLILQGKPIAEPVAQYGPFVMNTQAEIHQAMADYRRTEFGGWPFADGAPVHDRATGRFAIDAQGRLSKPGQATQISTV